MERLDLIFSERELDKVLAAVDACGAPGYSVMRHITGKGRNGLVVSEDSEIAGGGTNVHMLLFCEPAIAESVAQEVRKIFEYYGGVGFRAKASAI
ncbi:MAG: transcriptional regulator [Aphanocapsa feldmannii 277cV]|uniref:Transcriptional regulator n=2 Tax=Aphanocapsa feldmannii TaxID=192050 RepID=A0A524RLU3_9CHRO|nr:MAG: transcriptional regulator [Aphanocapsa feldmannii 288cV]TGG91012.1 MAG: transcriptional regulator [Aphanocapsa feldmannii 277cV]TGH21929.1 MAG: transcriptional regulator [Aphanocapsa feldmannii 277cI]